MVVIQKTLRTGARKGKKSKLCLVISFEDGMRAQYPVEDEREAIALYNLYSKLHPQLKKYPAQIVNKVTAQKAALS